MSGITQRSISLSIAFALTLGSAGAVMTVAPTEASAQEGRMTVKKRTTTTRTTRHHDTRRTRRHTHRHPSHHHRTHRHHRSGVRITVGSPHVHHRVHDHYYYGHSYYGPRYRTYPTETRVIVVDAPEAAEPVWEMPALSCPIRTEEERAGLEQWCATSRGNRHGLYRRFYDDGVLAAQGEYEYDQKEGVWLEFHPNGALREEGQYESGKRAGTWITWGADGEELVSVDY